MKLKMIVNPNAGKKRGAIVAGEAAAMLEKRGITCEQVMSEYAGHAVALAEGLDLEAFDGVVAVGGDGTLFEVINGLMKERERIPIPVGQIPVGTGNSFIRDLGIFTLEDAVAKISDGHLADVDVGTFSCSDGDFYFVNLLGAGFVSNVAACAVKYKKLGALSYILGVLEELVKLSSVPSRLTIDGTEYERDLLFVEICNSRFTGGDMMMAPEAGLNDGLLDVVVVSKITRRKLLKLFPTLFKGTHVLDDSVEVIRGKDIKLESAEPMGLNADGEVMAKTPIEVSLLPGAVRMFGGG